ncbi:MAG: hypothetical protein ACO1OB_00515 [Archangium sp.]
MRIRTSDVVGQLRLSYAAEAKALAGSNVLLSRAEATKVKSDDLRGAIAALIDGQPGVRLNVDMVVDEAIKRALQRLNSVNVTGTQFVSKAEVDAIKSRLPDLGDRFATAYDAAKAGAPPTPPEVVNATRAALLPWAGGTLPTIDVRLVGQNPAGREVEVDIHRTDGRMVTARLTLGAHGPQDVEMLTDALPVTGPVVASLEQVLPAGAKVVGFLERTDHATGKNEVLTAWKTGRQVTLSTVRDGVVSPLLLGPGDLSTAPSLALMMARSQTRELVNNDPSPGSIFEQHLRTAAATASGLKRITNPDESPVGIDPSVDLFQFQLPRVWGDTSIFVTIAKNGTARLEDFN